MTKTPETKNEVINALNVLGINTFYLQEEWWYRQLDEVIENPGTRLDICAKLRRIADLYEAIWNSQEL